MAGSGYRMGAAVEKLTRILGEPVTDGVAGLPEETLGRLADQITAARARQTAMLDEAVRQALSGVPLPVRAVARKALLG
jgi:hypothetical protein